jgi:hypothetical protein
LERLVHGIPLPEHTWASLDGLSVPLGVALPTRAPA